MVEHCVCLDLTGEGDGVRGVILHSFLEGEGEPDGDVEADLSSPERQ